MGRLLLTAISALALAQSANAARNAIYGVNDGNLASRWTTMAPRIAGLGIDQVGVWVRYHCGAADSDDWLVRNLPSDLGQVATSQPVMVQLLGAASCSPRTNAQRRVYARTARRLVRRYPNVRELQVWNEPDLAFWSGSVDSYVQLLAVVHDALRGTGVQVLGPGFSPNGLLNARNAQMGVASFAEAVQAFYAAHPRRRRALLDGFSYHPYWGFDRRTTSATARTLNAWWKGLPQPSPQSGLRFWWTETGAESTVNEASRSELSGYYGTEEGWPGFLHMIGDLAFQANRVATIALKARADPLIAADFNFELDDDHNLSRWQSGLCFADGMPKPAYYWFHKAIAIARAR